MTTQTPAPYQPANDDDARIHLAQIVGSDLNINVWTGDWHDTLRTIAVRWTPTRRQRITRRIRRALHLAA